MRDLGFAVEQFACDYLQTQGLNLIEKNYRSKTGEIDLIMRDAKYLIFIEVRYRRDQRYGGALESIDWHKQQRIINTAHLYLQKFSWTKQYPSRFDVVVLTGQKTSPNIEWIKDAFQVF